MMGKFYLRMDQEIQVYFMINPDLVGNKQGLHYGKGNTLVGFNKGIGGLVFYFYILVLQYFMKRESTFKFLNIFYHYFYLLTIFFQVHSLLS